MKESIRIAKSVIEAEAAALMNIQLDDSFDQTVEFIYNCKGKVIVTGIGKAGNIDRKIDGTLCSNWYSCIISSSRKKQFMVIWDFYPGEMLSSHFRQAVKHVKSSKCWNWRTILVSIQLLVLHHPDSTILSLCNVEINMGDITEPCPLGLTATSSTMVMMAIGDALALVLLQKRNFTKEQFGLRHHGVTLDVKHLRIVRESRKK